jgi:hypothetical protein
LTPTWLIRALRVGAEVGFATGLIEESKGGVMRDRVVRRARAVVEVGSCGIHVGACDLPSGARSFFAKDVESPAAFVVVHSD